MTTQMTDIERCACTLLSKECGALYDQEVSGWIDSILNNPDFADYCPDGKRPNWDEIEAQIGPSKTVYFRFMHDAIVNLGNNIVSYRHDNRPAGDTMHKVEDVAIVISSLAAQIVEFHMAVNDAWAMRIAEMEMER